MSLSRNERLRAGAGSLTDWLRDRAADVAHDAAELEARGRQVYRQAIRRGEAVLARTPAEVRQLAIGAATGRLPEVAAGIVTRRAAPAAKAVAAKVREVAQNPQKQAQLINEAMQQRRAFESGLADEASFGLADRALAAADALRDGGLNGWSERYDASMAQKAAEDRRDDQQYGLARGAGRVTGLVADTVLVPEVGGGMVMSGLTRFAPKAAKFVTALNKSRYVLDPRGLQTMAASGGAGAGVASQFVSDGLAGRHSSLRDYVGAAVGGAADGLVTLQAGPLAGGAIGGALTPALQSTLSQRVMTADDVLNSARLSAGLGVIGGVGGTLWAKALPSRATGELGELMSLAKSAAAGRRPFGLKKQRFALEEGGYTYPDHQFETNAPGKDFGLAEAKLGPTAELTRRQVQASQQPNIDYVIDGWKYSDVGRAAGSVLSSIAPELYEIEAYPWMRK